MKSMRRKGELTTVLPGAFFVLAVAVTGWLCLLFLRLEKKGAIPPPSVQMQGQPAPNETPAPASGQSTRGRLLAFTVGGVPMLLDTVTGRCWRSTAGVKSGVAGEWEWELVCKGIPRQVPDGN